MQHPDFRVGGRIFATLGYPDGHHGVVMLSPEQQAQFVSANPEVFAPVKGAWGRRGSTVVDLAAAEPALVRSAIAAAHQHIAARGK
jgi:hypothetical protein